MLNALVTGGNRGLGLATSIRLRDLGCNVIVTVRDQDKIPKDLFAENLSFVKMDFCSDNSISNMLSQLPDIDILVNNAGILTQAETPPTIEEFDACLAVMSRGPFILISNILGTMNSKGYGRIVNVSSGWGCFSEGLKGPLTYSVAKAALNALTVGFAKHVKGDVKINAICPGWMATRMGGLNAPNDPQKVADFVAELAFLPKGGANGKIFRGGREIEF